MCYGFCIWSLRAGLPTCGANITIFSHIYLLAENENVEIKAVKIWYFREICLNLQPFSEN